MHDIDFLVQVSLHKQTFSSLPQVSEQVDNSSQTEEVCQTCHQPVQEVVENKYLRDESNSGTFFGDLNPETRDQDDQNYSEIEDVVIKPDIDAVTITNMKAESAEKPYLASDLQCYFDCGVVFKKGHDLKLHLKFRHKDEDAAELAKAFDAMEFEIALTQRSGSVFQCGLCSKTVVGWSPFWEHVRKHGLAWQDYRDRFGKSEIQSASFQCRICNKVIKHEANCIHKHLQNLHGINWTQYLARVRGELRGIPQDPLPVVKLTNCTICDLNFKDIGRHVQRKHKLSMEEYQQLQTEENISFSCPADLNQNITDSVQESTSSLQPLSVPQFCAQDGDEGTRSLAKPPKDDMSNKMMKFCRVCEIEFETRKEFIQHCQFVHKVTFRNKSSWAVGKTVLQSQVGGDSPNQPLKMFLTRCSTQKPVENVDTSNETDCPKVMVKSDGFVTSRSFHEKMNGPISPIVWPKQYPSVCENCGEVFPTWKERDEHVKMSCHRVECEACGKTFSTVNNLKKHRRSSCKGSQMTEASSHCVAQGVVEQILSRVFSLSTGVFDGFTCPFKECGQQFGRKVHLKRHLSNFH